MNFLFAYTMCILKGKSGICAPISNSSKTGPTNACFLLVHLSASLFVWLFDHCFNLQRNPPHLWRNQWNSNRIHKYPSKLIGKNPLNCRFFVCLFNTIIFMTNLYKFILKIEGNALLQTRTMVPSRKQGSLQDNCCSWSETCPGSNAERGRGFGAGQVKQSWLLPSGK